MGSPGPVCQTLPPTLSDKPDSVALSCFLQALHIGNPFAHSVLTSGYFLRRALKFYLVHLEDLSPRPGSLFASPGKPSRPIS